MKGDLYEIFINSYLNTLDSTKNSYLWKDIPEFILYQANLITCYNEHRLKRKSDKINPLQDIGLDIITVNNNDDIIFIQCKNYTGMVNVACLSGFFMMMANHIDKVGYVYYSNKITKKVKENVPDRIILEHKPFELPQIDTDDNIKLFEYQKNIVDIYDKFYKTNNRGILAAPCGVGKTLMSCFISKNYDLVVFISPLKQFAEQNMYRYKQYDPDREILLVDSDGSRNVDDIIEFIDDNESVLLSATYKSADVIYEIIKQYTNVFIIIDEFHNLNHNNIYNNDDPINKIMNIEDKTCCVLFMSATPRIYELEDNDDCDVNEILGEIVYKMDFKHAIENKYICDYNIYLPILEDDSLNELNEILKNFKDNEMNKKCCYLFECIKKFGTLKCIIYFKLQNEIDDFIKCFNSLNEIYYFYDYNIDSITCTDNRKKRNDKLEKFKNNQCISFLCAVYILDECIDIPECNSIYMTYNSKSKVKNIQRMSRSMRIDKNNPKKIAKIILWCDEISETLTYMSSIKEIDIDFNTKIKCLGFSRNFYEIKNEKIYENKYVKLIIGVREYAGFNWMNMLEKTKQFININKKRPVHDSKNDVERKLGIWINYNLVTHKNKNGIMKNKNILVNWNIFLNEYESYFKSDNEKWLQNFNEMEKFFIENNRRPTHHSKNDQEKRMGNFIQTNIKNYTDKKGTMKDEQIYNLWTDFIEKYEQYFKSNEEIWYGTFDKLKRFIDKNNKKPSQLKTDEDQTKLKKWTDHQEEHYEKRDQNYKDDSKIYNEWKQFIESEKYENFFIKSTNTDDWINKLNNVKRYVDENKKRPNEKSKNMTEACNGKWISEQIYNYRNNKYLLKNNETKQIFEKFLGDYNNYFKINTNTNTDTNTNTYANTNINIPNDNWNDILNNVKIFMESNKKRPSETSKVMNEKTLGKFISRSIQNYKKKDDNMKNKNIRLIWEQFIEDFSEYFKSDEEIWFDILDKVKIYINENNKRPSSESADTNIKRLGIWLMTQNANYNSKNKNMNNPKILSEWENFIEDEQYKIYFRTNEEVWNDMLDGIKRYMDINRKRPPSKSTNIEERQMRTWLDNNKNKYEREEKIMTNPEIRTKWEEFIKQYQRFF